MKIIKKAIINFDIQSPDFMLAKGRSMLIAQLCEEIETNKMPGVKISVDKEYADVCSNCGKDWAEDEYGHPFCCQAAKK